MRAASDKAAYFKVARWRTAPGNFPFCEIAPAKWNNAASLTPNLPRGLQYVDIMSKLAKEGERAYRELTDETEGFYDYFYVSRLFHLKKLKSGTFVVFFCFACCRRAATLVLWRNCCKGKMRRLWDVDASQ